LACDRGRRRGESGAGTLIADRNALLGKGVGDVRCGSAGTSVSLDHHEVRGLIDRRIDLAQQLSDRKRAAELPLDTPRDLRRGGGLGRARGYLQLCLLLGNRHANGSVVLAQIGHGHRCLGRIGRRLRECESERYRGTKNGDHQHQDTMLAHGTHIVTER
jgi:hypothetical protein